MLIKLRGMNMHGVILWSVVWNGRCMHLYITLHGLLLLGVRMCIDAGIETNCLGRLVNHCRVNPNSIMKMFIVNGGWCS